MSCAVPWLPGHRERVNNCWIHKNYGNNFLFFTTQTALSGQSKVVQSRLGIVHSIIWRQSESSGNASITTVKKLSPSARTASVKRQNRNSTPSTIILKFPPSKSRLLTFSTSRRFLTSLKLQSSTLTLPRSTTPVWLIWWLMWRISRSTGVIHSTSGKTVKITFA